MDYNYPELNPVVILRLSYLELSEKMTKVGLNLTPEQENTLLHNVIDELSAEILSLKLKIESMD